MKSWAHIVAVVVQGRSHVFIVYCRSDIPLLMRCLGQRAADPQFPEFTWAEAAVVSKKLLDIQKYLESCS